jgi:hypothetical protein
MGHRVGRLHPLGLGLPRCRIVDSIFQCVSSCSLLAAELFVFSFCFTISVDGLSFPSPSGDTQLVHAPMPQVRSAGPAQTPNALTL